MKAKSETQADASVDSVTGLLLDTFSADDEFFEFKAAAELQHPVAEKAAPSRSGHEPPPSSPSQRHAPRAVAVAKPEGEVASSKSQSSGRVWRAAAVVKRERAAGRPRGFPSLGQQDLCVSRAAAANLGPAASPPSFPPLGQQAFRVWRAAAVARLERPTMPGRTKETEVAIKTVSNRDEGGDRLPEFDRAADEAGSVTPSSTAIEPDAGGHLPAADLYDFDLACKRALKEVVYDPDGDRRLVNDASAVDRRLVNDASVASVPLVRRRSSLKLAVCAAAIASVGVTPWIVPSFTEVVPSITQRLHLSIIARPLATMLSRSQVEEPRSSREAGPAVATVMPLAAPQLASFEKAGRSSSASSDAPRGFRSMVGRVSETLVTPEAEVKASQIPPDISAASQGFTLVATANSVPSAPGVQPSAAEAGASAVRPPEGAEAIVIAPSARGASEPPVLPEEQSASSRRIESMPRKSREADPADAVVPNELPIAHASMLPASGPQSAEGPAVEDLGSRLSADRAQFAKAREPARSPEPIGVAALQIDRRKMVYAERLVERAERLIDLRDVGGARLLLERAVSLGHGRSAHLLAQTYDPRMLRAWHVVGMNGDLIKAKEFYDRAKTGAPTGTPSR